MADYSNEIASAKELIAEFGGMFKFVSAEANARDPMFPWRVMSEDEDTFSSFSVMFVENGKRTIYIEADSLGGWELKGDMLVIDPSNNRWAFTEGSLAALDPAGDGQVIIWQAELVGWPQT